jgi:hypothetical protein
MGDEIGIGRPQPQQKGRVQNIAKLKEKNQVHKMADVEEAALHITVKRKSKKKPGFEVELRADGHYYITKAPSKCKSVGVGDRVLEINGTKHLEFKNTKNANELIDSFRLEV